MCAAFGGFDSESKTKPGRLGRLGRTKCLTAAPTRRMQVEKERHSHQIRTMNSTQSQAGTPKLGQHAFRVEGQITCTTKDGVQVDFEIYYNMPFDTDEPEQLHEAEASSIELVHLLIAKPFGIRLVRYFRQRIEKAVAAAAAAEKGTSGKPDEPTFNDDFRLPCGLPMPIIDDPKKMAA